jgi:subtilisin-like proprotein convertase family protein
MSSGGRRRLALATTMVLASLAAGLPGSAAAGLTSVLTVNSDEAVAIPNGSGAARMSFDLSTADGEIDAISTAVRVRHTRTQQLELYLKGPNAIKVPLSVGDTIGEHLGTGACVTGNTSPTTYTGFRDSMAPPLATGTAPYEGYWLPREPLSAFVGQPIAVVWKLIVRDVRGGPSGKLKCGSLQIIDTPD